MAGDKISPGPAVATLRVLREIGDELKAHDGRLANLEQGQVAVAEEVRLMAGAVLQVRDLLAERLDQRNRIDDHEARLRSLEQKVARARRGWRSGPLNVLSLAASGSNIPHLPPPAREAPIQIWRAEAVVVLARRNRTLRRIA